MVYCTQCGSSSTWPDDRAGIEYCNFCRDQFASPAPTSTGAAGDPRIAPWNIKVTRSSDGRACRLVWQQRGLFLYNLAFWLLALVSSVVSLEFVATREISPLGAGVWILGSVAFGCAMTCILSLEHVVMRVDGPILSVGSTLWQSQRFTLAGPSCAALVVVAPEAMGMPFRGLLPRQVRLYAIQHDGARVEIIAVDNRFDAEIIRRELSAAIGVR
jgi:hypothetical protein